MQVFSIAEVVEEAPVTDEQVLAAGVEGEVVGDQPPDPVAPPAPSPEDLLAQRDAVWAKQLEGLKDRLASMQPYVEQAQKAQEARQSAVINSLAQRIAEVSSEAEEPLGDRELGAIKSLLANGQKYTQWEPWINQNLIAANAMIMAGGFLGRDSTLGEFQDLARELATYQDPRLMQARVDMMKNYRESSTQAGRRQVAQARLASGVDTVPQAPVQTAGATDFQTLELKMANKEPMTANELQRYERMYAERRRG